MPSGKHCASEGFLGPPPPPPSSNNVQNMFSSIMDKKNIKKLNCVTLSLHGEYL